MPRRAPNKTGAMKIGKITWRTGVRPEEVSQMMAKKMRDGKSLFQQGFFEHWGFGRYLVTRRDNEKGTRRGA